MNSNEGRSRYDSDLYVRRGSRYASEVYRRRGSRYTAAPAARPMIDVPSLHLPSFQLPAFRLPSLRIPAFAWDKTIKHEKENIKIRAAAVAAAVMVVLYLAGCFHFSTHYYPGTQVMGMDCAGMSADEVRLYIADAVSWYRLTVTERTGEQELIYASQIDLTYHDDLSLEAALKAQKSYLWPLRLLQGYHAQVTVTTEYSEQLRQQVVEELPCMDAEMMTAPVDAYITIENNLLTVVPEVMGTTVDAEKVDEVIRQALDEGLAEVSLEDSDCYVNPTVYQDDEALNRIVTSKNKVLGADITIDFGDRTEALNTQQLLDMLSLDGDGKYYVSDETIWNYTAELAEKYDTYGGERTFYTTIGTVVELSGGDYGWQLNQDETAQRLLEAIRAKTVGSVEPVYDHTAMSRLTDDIGDTYIEICISSQEMWLYKDGELLVDTAVVTGNHSKEQDTPSGGVWAIDGKYTNYTLIGENYRTPVSYWLPFNGGVGIHDLSSRVYYGGTIYLTNGSHGCVNTPLDAVAVIYENVEAGTPVIVYE